MKQIATMIILFLVSWNITAQENKKISDAYSSASEDFSIIGRYYQDGSFLEHSYEYELNNKIKHLKSLKRSVITAGFITALGTLIGGGVIAVEHENLKWVCIPCMTVLTLGEFAGFYVWANRLENKAFALEKQSSYLVTMNNKIDLGMARYSRIGENQSDGLGLAIKFKF